MARREPVRKKKNINDCEENKNNQEIKKNKTELPKKNRELLELLKSNGIDPEAIENTDILVMQEIREEFTELPDDRDPSYITYNLADVLLIMLLATICNCNTWEEIEEFGVGHKEWLNTFLNLKGGIPPTDDTYRLISLRTNMEEMYAAVILLLIQKTEAALSLVNQDTAAEPEYPDVIACDGKVSRGSGRNESASEENSKPLNTLSAYSVDRGFNLGQTFIDEKTNEIPELPKLLRKLNITGSIITCDALNTQPETAQAAVDGGAMYVMAVKENRKTLYGDLEAYFAEDFEDSVKNLTYMSTEEKEHGVLVKREYYFSTYADWVYGHEEWPDLTAIGMVRRTVMNKNPEKGPTIETRYYICGGINDPKHFAHSVRNHWKIENSLHWMLDFTFKDDANKTMVGSGSKELHLLKQAAMAILKAAKVLYKPYFSMNRIRTKICHSFEIEIMRVLSILDLDRLIEANTKPT